MGNTKSILRSASLMTVMVCASLFGPASHAQDTASVTISQLTEELAKRDAVIVELLNRVRALEQAPAGGAPDVSGGSQPGATAVQARLNTGPAANTGAGAGQATEAGRRGDFDIDRLAAERALERALVQQGARLLQPGQFDIEPRFAASRRNGMFPAVLTDGGTTTVGEISQTIEVQERGVSFRAGLPWETQLEIGLPYITVDREIETGIDGTVRAVMNESGSGTGDATLSLSKVLATESGGRPNLIGRLTWLTGSGNESDDGLLLGGGHSGFAGRLSAYWRRDPVVLLVSGGYTSYDEGADLTPGDSFDVSLGIGLALSPETALQFSLNQTFGDEFERNGIALHGTDRVSSTLDLSVSTTLGRRLLLRGYTSAGLTDESPDYGFGLSLSTRFDTR